MIAIILAGGKGTRLKPFTMSIPKPLLPVGEMPIVEVVIRQLVSAGIDRVVLTLGHMAHLFTAVLGDGSRFGVPIEYCFEDEPLGTAGSLRLINDPGEHFLVMNGDILSTLDYRALISTHAKSGSAATIAVHHREIKIEFGVIEMDPQNRLAVYREKPVIEYDVSMGVNVLSRRALEYIPQTKFDMPDLMRALQADGQVVECYRTTEYWQDIGLFDDYQRASRDFSENPERFLPKGVARSACPSL
jgi:NDP-mannose synthase